MHVIIYLQQRAIIMQLIARLSADFVRLLFENVFIDWFGLCIHYDENTSGNDIGNKT